MQYTITSITANQMVFFFNFRPGHTLHVSLKIKEDEHRVGGYPDARFIASSSQKTIAVTEVI